MSREATPAEAKAIKQLQRIAATWPQTLALFSAAGRLIVIPNDRSVWDENGTQGDTLQQDAPLAYITGIPNDGGDPW